MIKKYLFLLVFLALVSSALAIETNVDFNGDDKVSVIVILKEKPAKQRFGVMGTEEKKLFLEEKRALVKEQQDKVLKDLNNFGIASQGEEKFHRFSTIAGFTGTITQKEFEQLKNNPEVEGIYKNRQFSVALNDSTLLVNSSRVNALVQNYTHNLTGTGQTVCVIDTGIDYNHTALGGGWGNRVLGGYDYINSDSNPMDDHGHGTHVAGIIGSTDATYHGVAPGVDFVALKACDSGGSCDGTAMLNSIDWCNNNSANYNITIISMSIGDHSQYNSSNCPTDFSSALATSVSLGMTVVVSSGNDGYKNGISSPACDPNATSVGSVGKDDAVPSYSNSGALLDLLAPGGTTTAQIRSLGVGGGYADSYGTSMACPHVSGAAAILNQYKKLIDNTTYSSSEIETVLKNTGVNITDTNGLNRSRIRVDVALLSVDNTTPSVSYLLPVANNSNTGYDYITVKINSSESISATLQFNNTNYSMPLVDKAVYQRTFTNLTNATYSLMVYLSDYAGNSNTLGEYLITVNNSGPSINSFVPNSASASVVEQSSLFFNQSSTDPDGDTLSYFWYLNETLQASTSSWTYTPSCNAHGDYIVTLVVSDGYINDTNTWNLEVNDTNCAPVANILTANGTIVEWGDLASLTTNSSDPDSDTLNYTWSLGDGAVVHTTNTTHNYTSTGNFTVVLTVNDTSLSDNHSIYVSIKDTTSAVLSNRYPASGAELSSSVTSATISLSTNENANCRYHTSSSSFNFSDGTVFSTTGTTSHSSLVSVSSGNSYNYYVKCNDSHGNVNSGSYTISFSVASGSTGGSTGGGGGSSSTTTNTVKKSFYYSEMVAYQTYNLKVNKEAIPFTEIQFTPSESLSMVDITLSVISEPPKNLADNFKFLRIDLENIKDSQITGAQIKFKINKTWFGSDYDPTKVSLYRYENGVWQKKITSLMTEDSTSYHYLASVPGFSYFAIAAEKKTAPVVEPVAAEPAGDFSVQQEVVEIPEEVAVNGAAANEIKEDNQQNAWYLLLLIPAAMTIALVIYFTRHKKPEKLTREKSNKKGTVELSSDPRESKKEKVLGSIVLEHKQAAAKEEIEDALFQVHSEDDQSNSNSN